MHKAPNTYVAYQHTLRLFAQTASKTPLEELDRKDILAFMALLKTQGRASRTIANNVSYLKTFFSHSGLEWPLLKTDNLCPHYACAQRGLCADCRAGYLLCFPPHQLSSDCKNYPPEGAAFNEITQSLSRFDQRERLSDDRFDRTGLK